MTSSSEKVRIYEVGPRDGLQNEKELVSTEMKVELIDLLSKIGFEHIEATAFVSPKWMPQMADAADIMRQISRAPNVSYAVLTPNLKGYERAIEAGADEVAIFGAASETFSQKNINCSIAESLTRFEPVVATAGRDKIPVRGYISCVAGCPYEGYIAPASVADVASALHDMGCYEISLGDTIGQGTPQVIKAMLDTVMKSVESEYLAGHFHDTSGRALENVVVALEAGLRTFDSAIAGLGGCPYAPGAAGNVSTLALARMLEQSGWHTGLDVEGLERLDQLVSTLKKNSWTLDHD